MCIILHPKNTKISGFTHKLANILGIKHSRARERHAAALEFNSFNHLSKSVVDGHTASEHASSYLVRLGKELAKHHSIILTDSMMVEITEALGRPAEALYEYADLDDFINYCLVAGGHSISIEVLGRVVSDITVGKEVFDYGTEFTQALLTGNISPSLLGYLTKTRDEVQKLTAVGDASGLNLRFEDLLPQYKYRLDDLSSTKIVHLYELPIMSSIDKPIREVLSSDTLRIEGSLRDALSGQFESCHELYLGDSFHHINQDYYLASKHLESFTKSYRNPCRMVSAEQVLGNRGLRGFVAPTNERLLSLNAMVGLGVRENSVGEQVGRADIAYPPTLLQSGAASAIHLLQIGLIGRVPSKELLKDLQVAFSSAIKSQYVRPPAKVTTARLMPYEGFGEPRHQLLGELISTWCIEHPDTTVVFSNTDSGILTEINGAGVTSPCGAEPYFVSMECGRDATTGGGGDSHVYFNNLLEPIIRSFRKTSAFNPKIHDTYAQYLPSRPGDEVFQIGEIKSVSDPRSFVKSLPFDKCRNVNVSKLDNLDWDAPIIFMGFDEDGCQIVNATYYPFFASYKPEFFDHMAPLYDQIRKVITGYMFEFENERIVSCSSNGLTCTLDTEWTEEDMAREHFLERGDNFDSAGYLLRYDVYIRLEPSVGLVIDESIAEKVREAINHGELSLNLTLNAKTNKELGKLLEKAHAKDVFSHLMDINEVRLVSSVPTKLDGDKIDGAIWLKARSVNTIFSPTNRKVAIPLPKQRRDLGDITLYQLIKGFRS